MNRNRNHAALEKALRDHLSPEAIAMIAAYLQPAAFHRRQNKDAMQALQQVEWFADTPAILM